MLGQWIEETDSAFELSRNENVQSLTIWLTPVGFSSECPSLALGQVAAIHIETTHSRKVTFRSAQEQLGHEEPFPPENLLDQYQSDSGEELVAISWILNPLYDRVRAISSVNANKPAQILVPEQYPPFDQIQKLYYTRYNRHGGQETAITVEAFFHGQVIAGIIFTYPSGEITKVGVFDATPRRTISFPRGSRLVGFSLAGIDDEVKQIEFEFVSNGQYVLKRLNLSAEQPHANTISVGYGWRNVWYQHAIPAENDHWGSTHSARDTVYNAPSESKLVGLYVSCQGMSCFGALYEPKVSL